MAAARHPGIGCRGSSRGYMKAEEIQRAVSGAGLHPLPPDARKKFVQYLELLEKWNDKLNLTAIREPEEIINRHFLESIQCAQELPEVATLLDFGSGAGFPGIPIALLRPEIRVTLGESQAKKVSFLREAVRSLDLRAMVFDGRIESMDPERQFEAVTLRAVDKMAEACSAAVARLKLQGWLIVFATDSTVDRLREQTAPIAWIDSIAMAGMNDGYLMLGRKIY
jgi:16S rRNA (guanine527-N7)-methyltransferase